MSERLTFTLEDLLTEENDVKSIENDDEFQEFSEDYWDEEEVSELPNLSI